MWRLFSITTIQYITVCITDINFLEYTSIYTPTALDSRLSYNIQYCPNIVQDDTLIRQTDVDSHQSQYLIPYILCYITFHPYQSRFN